MREEALERFVTYAARARSKPTFDLEEREWRLGLAAELRRLVEEAAGERRWHAALAELLPPLWDFVRYDCVRERQLDWLQTWLVHEPASSREAVAAFGAESEPPIALERFVRAVTGAGTEPGQRTVVALGSLLEFARDPLRRPIVQPRLFEELQDELGSALPRGVGPAAAYAHHCEFAREIEELLRARGIDVRDMLDAQALVSTAAAESCLWTGKANRSAQPAPRKPPHYIAACAIYRDEAHYLEEWLEFHRLVGVERFYLYDNGSADSSSEVLENYVASGIVSIQDWPLLDDAFDAQVRAYDHCIAHHGAAARWIAFLDVDEFLFAPGAARLNEVLVDFEQYPGVVVNWAMFGPSGHARRSPATVIESYVRSYGGNLFVKSIVDPARVAGCRSAHDFAYTSGMAVDENRFPVLGGSSKSVSFERLRVNHYFTKSVEEATSKLEEDRFPVHFLRALRLSAVAEPDKGHVDEAILRYLPQLRAALGAAKAPRA